METPGSPHHRLRARPLDRGPGPATAPPGSALGNGSDVMTISGSDHPSRAVWGGALTIAGTDAALPPDPQPATATTSVARSAAEASARRMRRMLAQPGR